MFGLLFVTAPDLDFKAINRFLLYLHDWEYSDLDIREGSSFTLVTTKDYKSLSRFAQKEEGLTVTNPPLTENFDNAWSGSDVDSVTEFAGRLYGESMSELGSLVLILDGEGFEGKTCVLSETAESDNDTKENVQYNKMRLPWQDAYITWCNLNIANMSFEEFCDDLDTPGSLWWRYKTPSQPVTSKKNLQRRDDALAQLEKEGYL